MGQPFLELDNLGKRFGGLLATDHISFSMGRHEMVGLIGPNGAGKTTLLRLITGVLRPDVGSVRFKGKNIVGRRPWDIVNRGIACRGLDSSPSMACRCDHTNSESPVARKG